MGELLKEISAVFTQWDSAVRATLRHDPGTLGRMANTVWFDTTPMQDRDTGITNAIDPETGEYIERA